LQEALQNAIKHSGSHRFQVALRGGSNEIRLSVHDTGIGFDPALAMRGQGIGLITMKERLKLVNGSLSIDSQLSRGTTVHAWVPLNPARKSRATGT
jgi:signal transduction histidine kinase